MLRTLARRSTVAAAAAVVAVQSDKLPIYSAPTPEIVLVDTPSKLERQIGNARRAVTTRYLEAHARVQGVVSRWIGVEEAVEKRVKSLVAPDEPVTPGILYVGVATLTGSIFARNRGLFTRGLLPPTLLVLSLNHFLPKTAHNISAYCGELEDRYFPTLAEKHEIANQHTAMTWERLKDAGRGAREGITNGVGTALERAEVATGLKLKETMGWSRGVAIAVEERTKEAAHIVEEKTEAAVEAVKETAAAAVKAVEQKTHAATTKTAQTTEKEPGVADKKADEPKRPT
ncbi:apolipo protein O-domain-containing protein [Sparassis latifolia]|uniref:MICOS complex subunit n=1 Tax=Sparassis crispa TaxID=139825 RepID=A0A401GYQ2_9APHY|nr:hypothetical protein SCP_1005410 [Sparassis crispa]GBE87293.1 hypothetical protein SCP_1005410 [Sparassis crispa]